MLCLITQKKRTLLYIACIVLFSIRGFYASSISASKKPPGENTEAGFAHIHTRSILSFSFRDDVIKTNLMTYFSKHAFLKSFAQKLLLWKRATNDEVVFGFGIEGENMVAGALRSRGFFRVFDDASKTYAWSLLFYERARWALQHASATVPLGIAISYELPLLSFSAWTKLSHFKSQHRIHATGLATTFRAGLHDAYKARFIYQYFMRKFLYLPKSVSRSWYLTVPSVLEVHSLATSHEFTASFINVQLTTKASIPDTLPMGFGALALLRFTCNPIIISLFAQGASPHYITSAMKYQRALWSQSAEFLFSYAFVSFVRMRYGISYTNPITDSAALRDTMDKRIHQYYHLAWKQEIPSASSVQHLLLRYEFASQYLRHKASVYYSFKKKSFDVKHGVTTTYKHRTKKTQSIITSPLHYIDMGIDMTCTKKEILPRLNAFVRIQVRMRVYQNATTKHAPKHRVIRDVTVSMGATIRIGSALFRISFPYTYKTPDRFSTAVLFSMRYTID